ncbi:hypothetical protein FisN_15Hh098 [Fistulifera solaris]|uniref:Uncharacterized protein n=1 Tax=Fistulifera solaris TaxID=1519565 RepID=A0A1Z5K9U7_FISSO|nr:hypothetical protein FisN_15Hh098 [Fistulifera solaris]|eukprot:GAX23004.1 hypothetical protein FisN_15Hh098 [Fistulifera solaris]
MLVMLFTLSSASETTLPATTSPASFLMGESALIDKETGRIFWEGGISNTLTAMLGSKVRTLVQFHHLRATILSSILWIGIIRLLAERWTVSDAANKVLRVMKWTLLLLPRFDTWFLWTMALLYGIESYFCTTRQYLTHCIASSEELEAYLEQLREVAPRVEWKVRSFHYEIISPTLAKIVGALQNMTATFPLEQHSEEQAFVVNSTDTMVETQRDLPSWMKRKKVTNFTIGTYQYQDCIDKTLASVWKRARGSYNEASLVSKITLSKLLVLSDSKTRRDYFKQQAAFVSEHCQSDSMAEFATNIVIPGFKPRLLAIRHRLDESLRARIALQFVSLPWFWFFTLLGLTAPYRFWFDDQCDELRVSVVKETSVEPRKVGALNNNKVPWFWSRDASVHNNDDECMLKEESNQFRMLMQDLKLYGNPSSDPMSKKEGVMNHNEELRKDELQDVIDSVESASILAKEETSSDSL